MMKRLSFFTSPVAVIVLYVGYLRILVLYILCNQIRFVWQLEWIFESNDYSETHKWLYIGASVCGSALIFYIEESLKQ